MGWGTSPRFVQGRYVVIVYNSREVLDIFQTEVKDCIPLLESEARAYCKRKEQENPKEKYNYTIIDRKNTLGGLEKNDESL